MAELTNVSWAHSTFNPWIGCVEVDALCDNCYARIQNHRYGRELWGKDAPRQKTSEAYWWAPLKWNRKAKRTGQPWRVFCGSWCDVMERRNDAVGYNLNRWRTELFDLIDNTPYLTWMLLTKRPQEFSKQLPAHWLNNPRTNVWLLTSIGTVAGYWRWHAMQQIYWPIKGVSMEPLLEACHLPSMVWDGNGNGEYPSWVIVGGESQSGARAMKPEWVRSIWEQCRDHNIPFHFKQWGEHNSELVHIGKKATGRLLDGREWNEFPISRGDSSSRRE